jgi:hypothetical protein
LCHEGALLFLQALNAGKSILHFLEGDERCFAIREGSLIALRCNSFLLRLKPSF